jgi:hypothetical protein
MNMRKIKEEAAMDERMALIVNISNIRFSIYEIKNLN